jgi:CPA1 family monovalent cation:H+ antiporter
VGLALGTVGSFVIRRTEDPLAEIMATTALAFAAFVGAEELHVSGAIAGVTAGLTVGATARKALSPSSQVAIHSFWEYMAFGVNTFLFLLVGLSSNPATLLASAPQTAIAVACVLAGRAAAIYLPFLVLGWVKPSQRVPLRWQHVFIIGNIKGALSIALALGLPRDTPFRPLLVDVAFGVTFISLVAQGLMLGRALDWLGLTRRDALAEAVAEHQAKLITARAARAELDTLLAAGLVPRMAYERLRSEYQVTIADAEREIRRIQERNLAQGARLLLAVRRRLIDAERAALTAAERTGLLSPEVAERHLLRLDERTLGLDRLLHDTRDLDVRHDRESAS